MVRLKVRTFRYYAFAYRISIPYGSIKRKAADVYEAAKNISIPYGSIKRGFHLHEIALN